ncbi:MAG: FecR family protein [Candidatus Eremiobacteraeota bacterium]|nr:FecR family protein [Candidatus Eremiobacteraeota bacterium]
MKRKIAMFLFICIIVATISAWAVSPEWKLVIAVKGIVQSQFTGSSKWVRIWQSRMLKDGDKARTKADSRAKIRLADNSVVTVGASSEVEVSQFKLKKQSRVVKIKLFFGKIRNKVGRFTGKESKYEVQTPNAVMAARGTDFYVEYDNDRADESEEEIGGFTRLMVFSDNVEITAGGVTRNISAGNSAIIGPSGIIMMNPANFMPTSAPPLGAKVGPGDADLRQYEATEYHANMPEIPLDPNLPPHGPNNTPPASPEILPDAPVVPPPGHTGSITVIVK